MKSGTIAEMSQTDNGGYGVWIKIDHGDGRVTQYSHLQNGSLDHWNLGDEVGQDTVIGYVGSTGTSTGPHLDLKYFEDGQVKDPLLIIAGYDDTEPVTTAYVPQATNGSKGSSSSKRSSGGSSGTLKSLEELSGLSGLKGLR